MPARPLPIATDTFQTRLIWTSASAPRPATNTLYFLDTAGGQTEANLWTDLDSSVTANMWDTVGGTTTKVNQVRNTRLNGVAAGVLHTPAGAKWASGSTGDPILQGAVVVSGMTAVRGPGGRGRVFLPWTAEGAQAAGVVTPGNLANVQTGWTAFLASMVAAGWQPVILNYVLPPTVSQVHSVTAYVARPSLRTQRRRTIR